VSLYECFAGWYVTAHEHIEDLVRLGGILDVYRSMVRVSGFMVVSITARRSFHRTLVSLYVRLFDLLLIFPAAVFILVVYIHCSILRT
jgi:hypothetical protein